jgi:alpha-tubulin suppressor-like RCC1 family protein
MNMNEVRGLGGVSSAAVRTLILALLIALSLSGCDAISELIGGGSVEPPPLPDGAVVGDGGVVATQGAAVQPQLCGGEDHTCLLKASGQVLCWGVNLDGQLGDGTNTNRTQPALVANLSDAVEVTCGDFHTCARRQSGEVSCWGRNQKGQLGNGTKTVSNRPVAVAGLSDAAEVSAGQDFTCARRSTGGVTCWGGNGSYQLGNGSSDDSVSPVEVMGLTDAQQISAGRSHVCALRSGGAVSCWGSNAYATIGSGTTESYAHNPVAVPGIQGATAVGAGAYHSCAVTPTGVMCWGSNDSNQMGNGVDGETGDRQPEPAAVSGLTGATAMTLGGNHACALTSEGTIFCWGAGGQGALGHGELGESTTAVQVQSLTGATHLAAGSSHTCALVGAGQLWCWGNNSSGQYGAAETRYLPTPQAISNDIASLSPGPSNAPDFTPTPGVPVEVTPQVSAGSGFVCGLLPEGRVQCVGTNDRGQLGNGSTEMARADVPSTVPGIQDAVQISSYAWLSCVCRANGQVACWGTGYEDYSEAGLPPSSLPEPIAGITDCAEVAVGGYTVCVRHHTGHVSCWGSGRYGLLGNGSEESSATPVAVQGLTDAVQLASAAYANCALRADGTSVCWGYGDYGSLGNGSNSNTSTPIQVADLSGASGLAAASSTVCAIERGGHVSCWGENEDGELGNGEVGREHNSNTPLVVRNLQGVTSLGMGFGTVCAVLQDGTARCWGSNSSGQTGHDDREPADVTAPRPVLNASNPAVAALGPYVQIDCGEGFCVGVHATGRLSFQGASWFISDTNAPVPLGSIQLGTTGDAPPVVEVAEPTPEETPEPPPEPPPEVTPEVTPDNDPDRPDRPVRNCNCTNVQRNCRIVYDEVGRPSEQCVCNPPCCCRGGRR